MDLPAAPPPLPDEGLMLQLQLVKGLSLFVPAVPLLPLAP